MADPGKALGTTLSQRPSRITCNALVNLAVLDHYLLQVDRKCRLIFARRTSIPFDTVAQIRECFRQIEQQLAAIPRERYVLLVDARDGPTRNDHSFELVLQEERGKLLFGFGKSAALAATAAGRLQIQRYAKHDQCEVLATGDLNAAFEHLGISPHRV
jgi:hypothetical protein